jgi:hypothetical protein
VAEDSRLRAIVETMVMDGPEESSILCFDVAFLIDLLRITDIESPVVSQGSRYRWYDISLSDTVLYKVASLDPTRRRLFAWHS